MYYTIQNSDGETLVFEYSKDGLEEMLEESTERDFLTFIPDHDTNYWGGKRLIIKGEIVVPEPVQVVIKFEVP